MILLLCVVVPFLVPRRAVAQSRDPVAQALADGDLYQSKRNYELALDAYHKADKLAHHTSSEALLKIALVEKKAGLLSDAANDAKKAIVAAQGNKNAELKARLVRATLLTQMSGKSTDNKLKDAEAELRAALALAPDEPVAHFNLGMVLLKQEHDADGLSELKNFITMPNADPATVSETKRIIANPLRARNPFAPDFAFNTLEDQSVSNASLRGKVALIDFWGTWCPPCRESVSILKNVQKKYNGKAFQLVSISSDDDEDVWKTFVSSQHMDWAEYLDSSGTLQQAFQIDSFPTYIVLDKDGVVRFRQAGLSSTTQDDLEDAINKALKRPSDPTLSKAAAAEFTSTAESESATASKNPALATTTESASTPASTTDSHIELQVPEAALIEGNVYTNRALRMRYEFPAGWTAEKLGKLHEANEQAVAALRTAFLKQHADMPNATVLHSARSILYASRRGDGDAQHAVLNSIRIQAVEMRNSEANEEMFRRMTERMVTAAQLVEVTPPTVFAVRQHNFIRAEFERKGALHYYQGIAETGAGDYLLTIEWVAATLDDLRKIGDSLQKMEISDEQ